MHDHIWQKLDRKLLAEIAMRGPTPVFASVSGAHLYGFDSPDSDVDLRGAFLLSAKEVLGLAPPKETITIIDQSVIDLDWVAHDIRKFARMMTQHNGYVLEQLFSPLVVVKTPAYEELLQLGKGCITRPTMRHYRGFARGRRARIGEPGATVKHVLYAYRALLTGIHLMHTGVMESNLQTLSAIYRTSEVNELIERKEHGAEKMLLQGGDRQRHGGALDALETELALAHEKSSLPEEPSTRDALDDFVVRLRLA